MTPRHADRKLSSVAHKAPKGTAIMRPFTTGPVSGPVYANRTEAGRALAKSLGSRRFQNPVVLAIPRGGLPVGYEIAHRLGAPLDVVVAHKLGAPGWSEFAIGAIAPGGIRVLNEESVAALGISRDFLEAETAREGAEIEHRLERLRAFAPEIPILGRTAIVADDGLATGLTAVAAVRSTRKAGAKEIVLAVPVAAADSVWLLRREVDQLVCPLVVDDFRSVGAWYRDFGQVSDADAEDYLLRSRSENPEAKE